MLYGHIRILLSHRYIMTYLCRRSAEILRNSEVYFKLLFYYILSEFNYLVNEKVCIRFF